jgi:hypothetical protein
MAGLINGSYPELLMANSRSDRFVKDGYAAIADLGDAIDATVFGLPSSWFDFDKHHNI